MPPTDEDVTYEDLGQMNYEDLQSLTWDQIQGGALIDLNGFTNTRANEVSRSTWNITTVAVDRS